MKSSPPPRSLPNQLTAASLIAAPALLLASALVMPALHSDEQAQLRTIASHSDRYWWFTVLLLAGTMLFVPAFHGLTRVTETSRALRLGSALVVFGAMASVGDTTTQFLIRQMATRGHATPQMADVITAFDSSTGAAQLFALGGLALTIGGVTAIIPLHRADLLGRAVVVVFATGLITNLAGFIAQSSPVIAGSSALLLISMTAIARQLHRHNPAAQSPAAGSAAAAAPVAELGIG